MVRMESFRLKNDWPPVQINMEVLPKSRDSKDRQQYWKILVLVIIYLVVCKYCLITVLLLTKKQNAVFYSASNWITEHMLRRTLYNFMQATLVPLHVSAADGCWKTTTPSQLPQYDMTFKKPRVQLNLLLWYMTWKYCYLWNSEEVSHHDLTDEILIASTPINNSRSFPENSLNNPSSIVKHSNTWSNL